MSNIVGKIITEDIEALNRFIGALSGWFMAYFDSKISYADSYLPPVPSFEYLKEIEVSCEKLRNLMGSFREKSSEKVRDALRDLKKAEKERAELAKKLDKKQDRLAELSLKNEKKAKIIDIVTRNQQVEEEKLEQTQKSRQILQKELLKVKEELENSKAELEYTCKGLNYIVKEAEKNGYVRSKTSYKNVQDYLTELRHFVFVFSKMEKPKKTMKKRHESYSSLDNIYKSHPGKSSSYFLK